MEHGIAPDEPAPLSRPDPSSKASAPFVQGDPAAPAQRPAPAGRLRIVPTILAIAAASGLVALVAFGVPDPVMGRLAQASGIVGLLPAAKLPVVRIGASRWAQDAGVLPDATRSPLEATSPVGRLREIRSRPPLIIETTTLTVPPGADILRIVAPALTLRDATLITNGINVEIETERLDIANSTLRAFAAEAGTAVSGNGRSGGHVRILVHGPVRGILRVDLSGQAGAAGTAGAAGAAGKAGDVGTKARSALTTCLAPAGRGGSGTAGGPGGAGGEGAAGGDGGTLEIISSSADATGDSIRFIAAGGAGGMPGPGGTGGRGGAGGLGGPPAGVCFGNGPAGADGTPGPAGMPGRAGANGVPGTIQVRAGA